MSVFIKQTWTWGNRQCTPIYCSKLSIRWNRGRTNDVLKERGLSQDILNQEIDLLNKKAYEFLKNDIYFCGCWFIVMLLWIACFVGSIVVIIEENAWMICIFIIVTCGCNAFSCVGIQALHQERWNDCLSHIRNYIEKELKPRYQSSHITWIINTRYQVIDSPGGGINGNRLKTYKVRYDDISIYPEPITFMPINRNNEQTALQIEKMAEKEPDADTEGNDTKIDLKIDSQNRENQMKIMCISKGYYKIGCFGTDKVIEVTDNSKRIGSVLQIFDETQSDNQWFYVERVDGDYYSIQCKHSGLYWNFVGSSKDNNRNVTQWNYHGLENQQFKFVDEGDGNFSIIARHSDKALCVENGLNENESKIVQCDVNDASEQLFHFK